MPLILANRVRDTTTTTGTGTITLSGTAPTGYQNFSVIGNANTTYYTINAGSQWEVGIGTFSSTGPTLARTTVLESSNANALVNFSAGTKDVFVTYPSQRSVNLDGAGNATALGTIASGVATNLTGLPLTTGVTGTLPVANGGTGVTTSTGTGNVVLSASPTLTGTVTTAAIIATGTASLRGLTELGATINTGFGVSTGNTAIELGVLRSADGNSFVDLHASAGVDFSARVLRSAGLNGSLEIVNLGTGALNVSAQGAAPITFQTTAAERMRIDSAGNVGIGTGSPGARLDVGAGNLLFSSTGQRITGEMSSGTLSNRLAFQSSTLNGNTNVHAVPNGTSIIAGFKAESDSAITTGQTASIDIIGGQEARFASGIRGAAAYVPMTFFNGGVERMRLDSAGNVGIGTGSPGTKLEVIGSVTANENFFAATGGVWFNAANAFTRGIAVAGSDVAHFVGSTERLRITSGGNVGIGTSSPGARLGINGGTGTSQTRFEVSTTEVQEVATNAAQNAYANRLTDAAQHVWKITGTERLRIDSAGNVGIGTSSPSSRLTVTGGITEIRDGNYLMLRPVGNAFDMRLQATGTKLDILEGGALGAPIMSLLAGGNVGIGTSSPDGKLDINGSQINRGDASGFVFFAPKLGTTPFGANYDRFEIRVDTGSQVTSLGNTHGGTGAARALAFIAGNNERMRIDPTSGNVGIGTSSPLSRFRVIAGAAVNAPTLGSITNYPAFLSNNDGSYGLGLGIAAGDGHTWLQGQRSDTGTAAYNITLNEAGGNVGIGTSSPGYRLDIASADTTAGLGYAMRLRSNATATAASIQFTTSPVSTQNGVITCTDAGVLTLQADGGASACTVRTAGTERMRIDSSGTTSFTGLLVGRSSGSTDVNTANDAGSFSVRGSNTTVASMTFHRTGAFAINMGLGTDNVFRIGGWSASSNAFQMDSGGNLTMLGNVTAYSDARIKKDVETIDSALDLVSKMRGVRYTRIDTKQRGVGVIAQEMLEVCPEVVQQGVGDDDTLSVAYGNLVGVLIEAVKELTARVVELEGK